jgi:hypothetical protein
MVPQWSPVLDVPDISFEVTQDVNGDGQQEVIYSEGLFEVRWDASSIADVVLRADAIAVTSTSCDIPDVNTGGDVAILFASNYPLQVAGNPSDYHDGVSGYAKLPNRPDADGVPGGTRTEPAHAPFVGSFYLMGNAERPGATHYRVHHQVDGGAASYLGGAFGPLMKVVGTTLQQLVVTPVDGSVVPDRAALGRLDAGGHPGAGQRGRRSSAQLPPRVRGRGAGRGDHAGGQQRDAGGQPADRRRRGRRSSSRRSSGATRRCRWPGKRWRSAIVRWSPARANRRVQFRLALRVSADHLRDFSVGASGCGPAGGPTLITDGRDGLPVAAADAAAHWYRDANDNAHSRELFFELPRARRRVVTTSRCSRRPARSRRRRW